MSGEEEEMETGELAKMSVNWHELASLMSSAMPVANVNLLCNEAQNAAEGESPSPVALEVRPRSRYWVQ